MLPKCVLQTPWRWNLEATPKNMIYCKSNPKWPRVTTFWQIVTNFLTIVATTIFCCAPSKFQPSPFSSSCKWNRSEARVRKGMEGIEKKKLALYRDNEAYHFFFQYSAFLLSVLHAWIWFKSYEASLSYMKLAELMYEH